MAKTKTTTGAFFLTLLVLQPLLRAKRFRVDWSKLPLLFGAIFQQISDDYHYLNKFRGAGNHRRGRPASGKARGR